MAPGCLVIALMHVIVKQAEIATQISAQSDTTLMFVMW